MRITKCKLLIEGVYDFSCDTLFSKLSKNYVQRIGRGYSNMDHIFLNVTRQGQHDPSEKTMKNIIKKLRTFPAELERITFMNVIITADTVELLRLLKTRQVNLESVTISPDVLQELFSLPNVDLFSLGKVRYSEGFRSIIHRGLCEISNVVVCHEQPIGFLKPSPMLVLESFCLDETRTALPSNFVSKVMKALCEIGTFREFYLNTHYGNGTTMAPYLNDTRALNLLRPTRKAIFSAKIRCSAESDNNILLRKDINYDVCIQVSSGVRNYREFSNYVFSKGTRGMELSVSYNEIYQHKTLLNSLQSHGIISTYF